MEAMGFAVTHLYGLTESFGPSTVCMWQPGLDDDGDGRQNPPSWRARASTRRRWRTATVLDPATMAPVPADGATMGELMLRGNTVMMGYLKNPAATDEAFAGGWFHTGDLAVLHPDGYVEVKDRAKDIIISGGENISLAGGGGGAVQAPGGDGSGGGCATGRTVGRDAAGVRHAEAGCVGR